MASALSLLPFVWQDESAGEFFKGRAVFISGGTGSLGRALTALFLRLQVKELVLYSRDEFKQAMMWKGFTPEEQKRIRFRIGDVRDVSRLKECMEGCSLAIHAAALKHVDSSEMNPSEAIQTNVIGAMNVVTAAKHCGVERVVALSTDKACNPINLYGATKLCSDSLFVAASAFSTVKFAVVRYGNVFTSRGSVVPYFLSLKDKGVKSLPVTHDQMTRFNISLDESCNLVLRAFLRMTGGEMFVPKLRSYRIVDLVSALDMDYHVTGVRPGEKFHEVMIPEDISRLVYEFPDHFVIVPSFGWFQSCPMLLASGGKIVADNFRYSSGSNDFLSVPELQALIVAYKEKLAQGYDIE